MKSLLLSTLILTALVSQTSAFKLVKDSRSQPRDRRLSDIATLQEEARGKARDDNQKIIMTNLRRDDEIKAIESIISEIGEHVDQINDTVNAKALEFEDTIDRIVNQRNARPDVYSLKPGP